MNIAVMYRTHIWNEEIESNYQYIKNSLPNVHVFVLYDSHACLPPLKSSEIHGCGDDTFAKRNWLTNKPKGLEHVSLQWHRGDAGIIDFSLTHRQYDYIWNIEYDITYDNWKDFIDTTSQHLPEIDFCATEFSNSNQDPHWGKWELQSTTFKPVYAAYFPVYCMSRRACDLLNILFQTHHGYCEVVTPTLLHHCNMVCKDIKEMYPKYTQFKHKGITPFGRYTDFVWHFTTNLPQERKDILKQWYIESHPDMSQQTIDSMSYYDYTKDIIFNYPGGIHKWCEDYKFNN